jgi:hypothetical protein
MKIINSRRYTSVIVCRWFGFQQVEGTDMYYDGSDLLSYDPQSAIEFTSSQEAHVKRLELIEASPYLAENLFVESFDSVIRSDVPAKIELYTSH